MKQNKERLALWQQRLTSALGAYGAEQPQMDRREAIYRGERRQIDEIVPGDRVRSTPHVRNIAMELIESMTAPGIPMPKVRAMRRQDERRARLIEDMLRAELDRLPMEQMDDLAQRVCLIQGGVGWYVEWDNAVRTHRTVGDVAVSVVHPRRMLPQPGVYTDIADMDWVILCVPATRRALTEQFGVDLSAEREGDPMQQAEHASSQDELLTRYIGYYRSDADTVGLYSWVGGTELCDLPDYQARHLERCEKCGAPRAGQPQSLGRQTSDGSYPLDASMPAEAQNIQQPPRGACRYCGGTRWTQTAETGEVIAAPTRAAGGVLMPGDHVPYYKPGLIPLVLQRNTSCFGSLLGESDIDKIADQQNTVNRLEVKIIDKLLGAGSYLTLPNDASVKADSGELKIIRLETPADKAMIGVHTTEGDISQDIHYLAQAYEEARQTLGITDSFQGRSDTTATSGVAKQFAAQQSAGRLQSRRVMKMAAFAKLYELIFKFKLAYADEPRPIAARDINGDTAYEAFNRFDFLERDEAGEWYWNDAFRFSCDEQTPLAEDRTAMWQETRMNLREGAFGDPSRPETLQLFWQKMEELHYPGSAEVRRYLENISGTREAQTAHNAADAAWQNDEEAGFGRRVNK